jgi:hypothetical protein
LLGGNKKGFGRIIFFYAGESTSKESCSNPFVVGVDETLCKKDNNK